MADGNDREPGFLFTTKNLSFTLSLITLTTLIFSGFSTVNSYAYKIDKIEQDYRVLSTESAKLTDKISSINSQIVDLTVTLGRLEERLDARTVKK